MEMGGGQHSSNYIQLLLFIEVRDNYDAFVWIIESKKNYCIWNTDASICDDGTVSIGCIVAFLNPFTITTYLGYDIPIIEPNNYCIVPKEKHVWNDVNTVRSLCKSCSKAYGLNCGELIWCSTSDVKSIDGNYPLVITTATVVITITPFFG